MYRRKTIRSRPTGGVRRRIRSRRVDGKRSRSSLPSATSALANEPGSPRLRETRSETSWWQIAGATLLAIGTIAIYVFGERQRGGPNEQWWNDLVQSIETPIAVAAAVGIGLLVMLLIGLQIAVFVIPPINWLARTLGLKEPCKSFDVSKDSRVFGPVEMGPPDLD